MTTLMTGAYRGLGLEIARTRKGYGIITGRKIKGVAQLAGKNGPGDIDSE